MASHARPRPLRRLAARLLTVALVGAASGADACRCVEPGPAVAYRRAEAVAQVQVTKVTGNPVGPGGAKVQLTVSRGWKAPVGDSIEVATSTTCAYVFEQGREYLVYLQRDEANALITRRCMGNRPLVDAKAALDWLARHGKAAPTAASAPR